MFTEFYSKRVSVDKMIGSRRGSALRETTGIRASLQRCRQVAEFERLKPLGLAGRGV